MATLDHPGIPKIIDGNTHQFATDEPLFFVMEFIDGPSLSAHMTGNGPVPLAEAVALVRKLLAAVAHAHEAAIFHRDIKPANIVLRNGSPSEPVLVDFGLAFAPDPAVDEETLTAAGEQIGNRFIQLPERLSPGGQRDPRSDLTSVVGILLYLLSGQQPGPIRDEHALPPHERPEHADALACLSDRDRYLLAGILATAFKLRVDERWQTTADLDAALLELETAQESSERPNASAGSLQQLLQASRLARERTFQKRDVADQAADSLGHIMQEFRGRVESLVSALEREQWPLRVMDTWNGCSTALPPREMFRVATSSSLGATPALFRIEGKIEGVGSVYAYAELLHDEDAHESCWPFTLRLMFRSTGEKVAGRNLDVQMQRAGSLSVRGRGKATTADLAAEVASFLTDTASWGVPRESEQLPGRVMDTILQLARSQSVDFPNYLVSVAEISTALDLAESNTLNSTLEQLSERGLVLLKGRSMGDGGFQAAELTAKGWSEAAESALGLDPEALVYRSLLTSEANGMLRGSAVVEECDGDQLAAMMTMTLLSERHLAKVDRVAGGVQAWFGMLTEQGKRAAKAGP